MEVTAIDRQPFSPNSSSITLSPFRSLSSTATAQPSPGLHPIITRPAPSSNIPNMSSSWSSAPDLDSITKYFTLHHRSTSDLPPNFGKGALVTLVKDLTNGGRTAETNSSSKIRDLYGSLFEDKGYSFSSKILVETDVWAMSCIVLDGPRNLKDTAYWTAWEEFDQRSKRAKVEEKLRVKEELTVKKVRKAAKQAAAQDRKRAVGKKKQSDPNMVVGDEDMAMASGQSQLHGVQREFHVPSPRRSEEAHTAHPEPQPTSGGDMPQPHLWSQRHRHSLPPLPSSRRARASHLSLRPFHPSRPIPTPSKPSPRPTPTKPCPLTMSRS